MSGIPNELVQKILNTIDCKIEDEEEMQKLVGKLINAFLLAMKDNNVKTTYDSIVQETNGINTVRNGIDAVVEILVGSVHQLETLTNQMMKIEQKLAALERNLTVVHEKIDTQGMFLTYMPDIQNGMEYTFHAMFKYIESKHPQLASQIQEELMKAQNTAEPQASSQTEPSAQEIEYGQTPKPSIIT